MVNLFIANTDNSWFNFLSSEPNLSEVNFWWPGEMAFRALNSGELLVFRLKSPRNKIGGYGVFSSHALLPIQVAWDAFGRGNGTDRFESFMSSIARLRGNQFAGPATNIGCSVLTNPVFLPPHLWIDLPPSWSSSIQRGKLYSAEEGEGLSIWQNLLNRSNMSVADENQMDEIQQARYGAPILITPRLGQGAFRIAVTDAYDRQCAITDGKVLPALDAAHIKPFGEGGLHSKPNGILMRKDIHCVFDAGYVTVDQEYRFSVSNKVKEIFNNGEEYLRLHGKPLRLPKTKSDWPDRELLQWHRANRFLG